MMIALTARACKTKLRSILSSMLIVFVGVGLTMPSDALAHKVSEVESGAAGPFVDQLFKGNDSGSMTALTPGGQQIGQCALKHTDVHAQISGYMARVSVKQSFQNPFKQKIEAVYTFPLPESAAVDDMVMTVGSRTIHGTIKKREEARQIYETAKKRGRVASLLDQERPNIFVQSVANIEPGKEIEITLQYSDLMTYSDGRYSFAFPTVVGPRFMPGQATGNQGTGWSPDTASVPDASLISPPVKPGSVRAGHDISISVDIGAGMPISLIRSVLHPIAIKQIDANDAHIELENNHAIPNKDFVLSWQVCGERLQSGYLTHRTGKSGYATFMLLPPHRIKTAEVAPKEMIFLIDRSGSQSGAPLEKAKETLNYIVDHMNPQDTFQVISFSDQTESLFDKPQPANQSMKKKARKYIASLEGDGSTWMGPAVKRVCSIPTDEHRLRIVTFMTDGYIGNDFEILGLIHQLRATSRWFSFGTGDSVNRFLIDGIAKEGGGEAEYVMLDMPGDQVGKRFYDRISSPVLTDVALKFEGVQVEDVFPRLSSDVWAEKPLYFKARYTKPGKGVVKLTGFAGGKPYEQSLSITLPEYSNENAVLPQVWARSAVDALMSADWFGEQNNGSNPEIKEEIIRLALAHHIMTQFTSFVAVDETSFTGAAAAKQVAVPVEMPEGVSYDKIFGNADRNIGRFLQTQLQSGSSDVVVARSAPASATAVMNAVGSATSAAPAVMNAAGSGTSAATAVMNAASSVTSGGVSFPMGLPTGVLNWFVASARDANLFDGGSSFPISISTPAPTSASTSTSSTPLTPVAVSISQLATSVPVSPGSIGSSAQFGAAPVLQGASNATIGPQTEITGVNTAGTVRVNNLANLEFFLNVIGNCLDLLVIGIGLQRLCSGLIRLSRKQPEGRKRLIFGVVWLAVGFLCSPLLIPYVGWKLLQLGFKKTFGKRPLLLTNS